jgi:hypothetical protein
MNILIQSLKILLNQGKDFHGKQASNQESILRRQSIVECVLNLMQDTIFLTANRFNSLIK